MIYLDHAATNPTRIEALNDSIRYFGKSFGNPSSTYKIGFEAQGAINKVKEIIAEKINCNPEEIFFTSGGSESDTQALMSVLSSKGGNIISQPTEHKAVLHSLDCLKNEYEIRMLDVDKQGLIDPKQLLSMIDKDTRLVSIMFANNEIGTIQPIEKIGEICRSINNNIIFHTDAVQAFGKIEIDVQRMNIDLLSGSAHKIGGFKGVGFLYVRKKYQDKLTPIIQGGGQQHGLRPGTENVPGIVSLGAAIRLGYNGKRVQTLTEYLRKRIKDELPKITFNNPPANCLYSHTNICLEAYGVTGEQAVAFMDTNNICISSGSACNSASGEPSHVLKAIGLSDKAANSSIRVSLGEENTEKEIDEFIMALKALISLIN